MDHLLISAFFGAIIGLLYKISRTLERLELYYLNRKKEKTE